MVGVGILTLPRTAAETARQGAWLAVILGSGLPFIGILLTYLLVSRYPNLTLAEYSEKIMGKFLGKTIAFIYAGYTLLLSAAVLNNLSFTLNSIALPRTPNWVLDMAILLVCANYARQGFKIIGRLNEFLFYALIPILLLLLPAFREIRVTHLLPLTGVPLTAILQGVQSTVFSYLGFEILLVIYPFLQKKEDFFYGAFIGLGITVLTYLYVVVIGVAYFGPGAIAKVIWPTIGLLNAIRLPIVERLEFFFIFLWVGVAFRAVGLGMFASSYTFSRIFKLTDHGTIAWLIILPTFFVAQYYQSLTEAFVFADQMAVAGIGIALGIPIILLSVSLILGKKEDQKKSV